MPEVPEPVVLSPVVPEPVVPEPVLPEPVLPEPVPVVPVPAVDVAWLAAADVWLAAGVVLVTGLSRVLTTDPRALVTGSVTGWRTPATPDVTPESVDGWLPAAAWAGWARSARNSQIPPLVMANLAVRRIRRTMRRVFGFDIGSSQSPGNSRLPSGCPATGYQEAPGHSGGGRGQTPCPLTTVQSRSAFSRHGARNHALTPVVLGFSATFGPQGGYLAALPGGGDLRRCGRAVARA